MGTILKWRRLQLELEKSSEKGVRGKEAHKNPRKYDGAHFQRDDLSIRMKANEVH